MTFDKQRRIAEVDRLAMLMCEDMGLDPYTNITCQIGDDMTPYDTNVVKYQVWSSPISFSINGQTHNLAPQAMMSTVPQWRLFRPHAAMTHAYQRALNQYMLCEDQVA